MGSTQPSIGDISKDIIIMHLGKNVVFKSPLYYNIYLLSCELIYSSDKSKKHFLKNVFNGTLGVSIKIKNIYIPP